MKQKMPMHAVPVLELEDGRKLSQSLAIGRYLATKHGLMSEDMFENAWGDQLVGALEDIYPKFFLPLVLATVREKDEVKRKEAIENMMTNAITPLFEMLEKFLGDEQWFCGKKIHWSDLVVAELVDRVETVYEPGFTATKFPRLFGHRRRVHELPRLKKYIDKRPQYRL